VASYVRNLVFTANRFARPFIPAHVRFLRNARSFGEREIALLPELIRPDTLALDIGANLGAYAYAMSKLVGGGRVVAIEPIPRMASLIRKSALRLSLPIQVIECAVSATDGVSRLSVPRVSGRLHDAWAKLENEERAGSRNDEQFDVTTRSLDSIVFKDLAGGEVSFIKIDVEGHELKALAGAKRVIDQCRPNFLIEIEHRHSGRPVQETFDVLLSQGYSGYFLDPSSKKHLLREFDVDQHQLKWLPDFESPNYINNFVFIPEK
jgi:FkbM family methyltransferase